MNVLLFETNELLLSAEELNRVAADQCIDYRRDEYCDIAEWSECGQWAFGFLPGEYRIYRPEHVSKCNPHLDDLAIFKI